MRFFIVISAQPQYKTVLLPPALMYNLCKGNFAEYNDLMIYCEQFPLLYYKTNFRTIAFEILKNVGLRELDKVSLEARKIFDGFVVNNILSSVIIESIVMQSSTDGRERVVETVKLAEVDIVLVDGT